MTGLAYRRPVKDQRRLSDFAFFLVYSGGLGLLFLVTDGPAAAASAVLASGVAIALMSLWRRRRSSGSP
jgi:hypothetical protein